ncbi:MAG: response regulator [Prolixibacteraceae bacterium]
MMETILIIEDTYELRASIAEVLRQEGYNVLQAENGRIGIEQALQHAPDLILCDIMMPGADGFEVLKFLKQQKGLLNFPFIYMSALEERKSVREGMELGADDYLVKPFTIDELLKAIQVRLDKHRSIEVQINSQIEIIEQELQTSITELKQQVDSQEVLLGRIVAEKEEVAGKLIGKQEQLMQDALRSIEINNTLMEMFRQLTIALQKDQLTEVQRKTFSDLRNKLRTRSILLNNQTVFLFKFEQTYPNFKQTLLSQYPKLRKQDLVLLATTFMHLDTNQQGAILNITPESIRKKKYRLKMKMELGKEQDLSVPVKQFTMGMKTMKNKS